MLHHYRLIVTALAVSSTQADTIYVDDDNCAPPPVSDCCIANGTPGCADPECEAIVCDIDPYCCDTEWDPLCSNEAADLCGEVCNPILGSGTEEDPYCLIQAAIDNAVDTDEIVVAPGTYFEAINILGKAIWLHSSSGPEVTIIDAQQTGSVMTVDSGEGAETMLDGFTLTGGTGTDPGNGVPRGGGMINLSSSPTVTNCTFSGNTADDGGGMFNLSSSPTVTNCTFSGNTAVNGGGMFNSFSSPTVTNCTFSGNTVSGSGSGGGMFNTFGSPTVTNCTFSGNTASFGSGGGMISLSSSPTVTNCTFSGNTADEGGGMFNAGGSPTVTNCILWADGPIEIVDAVVSTTTVLFSDVEGGFPGTGNIDADPLFVDPGNGDYRLRAGSPAIDAGHNWAIVTLTVTDLDGNPRFAADENDFDPGCGIPVVVDMGAYEYQGDPFPVKLGDIDGDGIVGIVDFLALLADWGSCVEECCLADLDLDGFVDIIDFLFLLGNWG